MNGRVSEWDSDMAAPTVVMAWVGLEQAKDRDEPKEQNKSMKTRGRDGSKGEGRKLLQQGSNPISLHGSILYPGCVL